VAGDRQYDSAELRQWTKEAFQAETAIPTIKGDKKAGLRVDSKFRLQVQSSWLRPTMKGFAQNAYSRN